MTSTVSPNGGARDPDRLPPFDPTRGRLRSPGSARPSTRSSWPGSWSSPCSCSAMGVTSILVIREMNQRGPRAQIELQEQSDLARQAIYAVTSQSHFRAMALTTLDDSWNDKIADREAGLHWPTSTASRRWADRACDRDDRRMRAIDERYADRGRRGAGPLRGGRVRPRARPPHLRRARDLPRDRGRAEPADHRHRGSDRRERRESSRRCTASCCSPSGSSRA